MVTLYTASCASFRPPRGVQKYSILHGKCWSQWGGSKSLTLSWSKCKDQIRSWQYAEAWFVGRTDWWWFWTEIQVSESIQNSRVNNSFWTQSPLQNFWSFSSVWSLMSFHLSTAYVIVGAEVPLVILMPDSDLVHKWLMYIFSFHMLYFKSSLHFEIFFQIQSVSTTYAKFLSLIFKKKEVP